MLMTQSLESSVILDKFPKSVIDIYALVIEADGSCLSAAITCSSLALASAGIEMYDIVTSTSVAIVSKKNFRKRFICKPLLLQNKKGKEILLDPTAEEEKNNAHLVIAYMPSLNEITQVFQSGQLQKDKTQQAIDMCLDGCIKINELASREFLNHRK